MAGKLLAYGISMEMIVQCFQLPHGAPASSTIPRVPDARHAVQYGGKSGEFTGATSDRR